MTGLDAVLRSLRESTLMREWKYTNLCRAFYCSVSISRDGPRPYAPACLARLRIGGRTDKRGRICQEGCIDCVCERAERARRRNDILIVDAITDAYRKIEVLSDASSGKRVRGGHKRC